MTAAPQPAMIGAHKSLIAATATSSDAAADTVTVRPASTTASLTGAVKAIDGLTPSRAGPVIVPGTLGLPPLSIAAAWTVPEPFDRASAGTSMLIDAVYCVAAPATACVLLNVAAPTA